MRRAKGTPTPLNVWVMAKMFYGGGRIGRTEIYNMIAPTEAPHMKRVLDAGFIELSSDRRLLRLTPAGVAAIAASSWKPGPHEVDVDEDAEVLRRMRNR
jgi:hypothetical protein